MSSGAILLIVILLVLVGVFPVWTYSTGWGFVPSGIIVVVLVLSIALILARRL